MRQGFGSALGHVSRVSLGANTAMKRTDLAFRYRLAVSKLIGKADAERTTIHMRLVGDEKIWEFGDRAEFELHEDGFLIRNGSETLAVPFSSIVYLKTG